MLSVQFQLHGGPLSVACTYLGCTLGASAVHPAPVALNTCGLFESLHFQQQPGSTLAASMHFTACYMARYNPLSLYDVTQADLNITWYGVECSVVCEHGVPWHRRYC